MNLPRVSVVVTAYLAESRPYLENCIASIRNLDYPQELLDVILVTPTWFKPEFENVRTVHPCYGAYHNPPAINYGASLASKDSKHLLLLNDDIILTRDSLKNMVITAGDADVILSAISNCDQGDMYQLMFPHGLEKRQYRLDEISHLVPEMMNASSPYPWGLIFPRMLYLYANLIPVKVWNSVTGGTTPDAIGFDTNFETGADDVDYCLRAQKHGVKLAICLNSIIWHMSGASADKTLGPLDSDKRVATQKYFEKKWGFSLV